MANDDSKSLESSEISRVKCPNGGGIPRGTRIVTRCEALLYIASGVTAFVGVILLTTPVLPFLPLTQFLFSLFLWMGAIGCLHACEARRQRRIRESAENLSTSTQRGDSESR